MFAKPIALSRMLILGLTIFAVAALLAIAPEADAQPGADTDPQTEISDNPISLTSRVKGTAGDETFEIRIGTWVIASGEASTEWTTVEAMAPSYAHGNVEVAFANDNTADGADRNLYVDYLDITIDDTVERIESESPFVYSEGAYSGFNGCSPGFVQSEVLGCAGKFVYAELNLEGNLGPVIDPHGNQRGLPPAEEHDLDIVARGHFGGERFTVRVGGEYVGEAATTRHWRTYRFFVDPKLTGELEIIFEGDYFADGIDTNLDVDYAELRSNHFETEDESTLSTGTYSPATGCAPGNKKSQTLHCNGKFVLGEV